MQRGKNENDNKTISSEILLDTDEVTHTSPTITVLSGVTSTSFKASQKNALSGFPITVALTPVAYSRPVTNAPMYAAQHS